MGFPVPVLAVVLPLKIPCEERACRMGNSRGQVKKKVSGISRSDHEQAILVFGVGISIYGVAHNFFVEIPREALFSPEFPGVK